MANKPDATKDAPAKTKPNTGKETAQGLSAEELAELAELRAYRDSRESQDKAKIGLLPEYENYKVPKGEENHAHLLIGFITKASRVDRNKDELGRKKVHKLTDRAYTNFLDNMTGMGYKIIKVLHLPKKGFLAPLDYYEQKAKAANAKKEAAKKAAANADAAYVMK